MNIDKDDERLKSLGGRIELIMELRGMQPVYVADKANISINRLSNYIHNRRLPDINILTDIADVLKVDINFLLAKTDDYSPCIFTQHGGRLIEIKLEDGNVMLSKQEIEKLLNKLESVGWDINKILK